MQSAAFTVSRHSKYSVVAGAIAARAREDIGPLLTAIGDEAVCNAIMAVCTARLYLEEDNLDIRFIAKRETIEKTGGDGVPRNLKTMVIRLYVESVE